MDKIAILYTSYIIILLYVEVMQMRSPLIFDDIFLVLQRPSFVPAKSVFNKNCDSLLNTLTDISNKIIGE